MVKECTDAVIATKCQLGQAGAWETLVERWHPRMWRFVTRMLVDTSKVEDVLQDIWMRVIRSLVRLREPEQLGPWMYRIARLAVVDHLRKQYRSPPHTEFVDAPANDQNLEEFEISDAVEFGLARLHPIDREAVVLFYFEHRTIAEIVGICAVPAGTIKSRLHRARLIIRDILSNRETNHVHS